MKRISVSAIAIVLVFSFFACNVGERTIDEQYVAETVKKLSSDELKGRKVFSPEIDMAADMIAADFGKHKLAYLPGLTTYKQSFSMYSITNESVEANVNGTSVAATSVFGMYDEAAIAWTNDSGVKTFSVDKDGRFQAVFSEARGAGEDAIVLVHTQHAGIFGQYKNYFDRGSNKFELGKESNLVFVLTDDIAPENFNLTIKNKVDEKPLANVAGMIEGKRKDEIVLFSAHYDHIGELAGVDGDVIANGANDDASGTAAVMALSKYFKEGEQPERTIYFVAFTAEEVGGYGSQYFSKQLNPDHIMAMFNIEMIGKPAVEGPNTAWITGFDKSDFGTILQKSVEGTQYKFYPDPYPTQNLFYRSDNATLARLGVPAHSISTTPIDVDKDYHQVSDEFETLDVAHMTNTIKAIAKAAVTIISGEATPTRVDKAKVD